MASWIADVEAKLFTIVKYKGEKELKEDYPNIYYTTDNMASTETHYPTVYMKFLPNGERGRDLEGNRINSVLFSIQLEVTVSKAQGQTVAKKVIWQAIETLQKECFEVFGTPEDISTSADNKRFVARLSRVIDYNDYI